MQGSYADGQEDSEIPEKTSGPLSCCALSFLKSRSKSKLMNLNPSDGQDLEDTGALGQNLFEIESTKKPHAALDAVVLSLDADIPDGKEGGLTVGSTAAGQSELGFDREMTFDSTPSPHARPTTTSEESAPPMGMDSTNGLDGVGRAPAFVRATAMKLPETGPEPNVDLRNFLRAGDILNYIGGNIWGHVVLLLAKPIAVEIPVLFDVKQGENRPLELGRNVVAFVCSNSQSASNLSDISTSQCALVVHPERGDICPIKSLPGGAFQICAGRDGPVTMELLLSPLNNKTLDSNLFQLAVEELHRRPDDTKWSVRTAVRGYLRHAELKPSSFKTRKHRLALANQLRERWSKRPVCSTIPPRVWQKYLLKVVCKEGPSPDTEVRWVDEVLRIMPVKDDRVLPQDLSRILLRTGLWQRLDLEKGPPIHRCNDLLQDKGSLLGDRCGPMVREPLSHGLKNSKGLLVQFGENGFNVYCGRRSARPQKIWAAGRAGGHKVEIGRAHV